MYLYRMDFCKADTCVEMYIWLLFTIGSIAIFFS